MKKLLYLLCPALLFFNCGSEKKHTQQTLEQKQIPKLLTDNTILLIDSAKAVAGKANLDQILKAKQLFLQGLDLTVNKQKPEDGLKLFRESLSFNPANKTYFHLANTYVDLGNDTLAEVAIKIATELGYDNGNEIDYTYLRIHSLGDEEQILMFELTGLLENGFISKKRLDADKCFDKYRDLREFESLMVTYFSDESKIKAKLFKSFLAEFPETQLPIDIIKDSILLTDNNNYISYDFAPFITGMENGRFSRDVTNEYIMVSKFKIHKNVSAIIYKVIAAIVDTLPPIDIKLATFDSLGNLIEEIVIAKFQVPTLLNTARIDEDGTITLKEYKINWESDPTDFGYSGNVWLGEEFVMEEKIKIKSLGKLDEVKTDVVKE